MRNEGGEGGEGGWGRGQLDGKCSNLSSYCGDRIDVLLSLKLDAILKTCVSFSDPGHVKMENGWSTIAHSKPN
jgi:hypothetical protein